MPIRSFDPILRLMFAAATREALNRLMNSPHLVNRRLAAIARKREGEEMNARHMATFLADAKSKRRHQNAKRLCAKRKGGCQNNSRALHHIHSNERLADAA